MFDKIAKLINSYDSFLITTHINPDGDAIGSEVALKIFLEDLDKNVVIVNSSATPRSLAFLDPDGEIKIFPHDVGKEILEAVDVIFILDVNNSEHLGGFGRPIEGSSHPRVCIDHHEGEERGFADISANDATVAATGVLVHDLIQSMAGSISRAIADAIYATIITDTGTFRFSNTDARTFRLAAELCDRGVNPFEIHRHVFGSKTWGAGNLLGPVLGTVEHAADGRLAWIHVTQKMINDAHAIYDDTDGFVDLVRAIKGVELVLFFKELPDGNVKVSLRSNGRVDAFVIAESYGGGGHRMASGMRVEGPMEKAIEKIVATCLQMDVIKNPPD